MIWWFENPKRSKQEREDLDVLAAAVDWLVPIGWRIDSDLRLIWDAEIVIADETFSFSLRYPGHFPYSPPLVLPRDSSARWSMHQYGSGGELCLEYGPDNWHSDLAGAEMVRSAHRLLQGERPSEGEFSEVPSRHQTTLGQDLRGKYTRFLVSRTLDALIATLPESVVWTAKAIAFFHDECTVNVVASIERQDEEPWAEELPEPVRSGYDRTVAIARWPENDALPSSRSLTGFRERLTMRGLHLPEVRFLLLVQGTELHAYSINDAEDKIFTVSVIPAQPDAPRLDQDHSVLSSRKVGIVGCGSLGSKLAALLARAGVEQFLLVDDDILYPDNLIRHDLDWRDVGRHKVDAVATRIQLVNPRAACERRKHKLGGQESSGSIESLIGAFGQCDLLIDATADPSVFNYLAAAAIVSETPLLWAEVFGGGFGGLIARYRPQHEPDPQTMRRAIENWWAERGNPAERSAGRYEGSSDIASIANDADVTAIAGQAARVAIDMLIPREPSMFPNSVYMIGLAKGRVFEQPFETYPVDVGGPNPAAAQELDPAEGKAELERIIALLKEYKDAASPEPIDDGTPPQ